MIFLGIAVLAAVFLVVFACSLTALASSGMFRPGSRFLVAGSAAALSVVGLLVMASGHRGETSSPAETDPLIMGLLLPYATLAIALIVLFLLWGLGRVLKCLPGVSQDIRRFRNRISRQVSRSQRVIAKDRSSKT